MANVTATDHDTSGWREEEMILTALELPPVPPTSDPQRLLGYVLHILPRYTEMEMLTTHLRLYVSTLEQDMEQVKGHVRLLTREVMCERERKKFLERYAAQVIKERNELLHSRGSVKKKAAATSHFSWHSCCKKNARHAMDLAPSILAFRGEKLQEAMKQVELLQAEIHNQELLRKELDFLLKKTQREHDSKTAADRKHIQHLEKQVLQRAALHSNLERKLYEVESLLARHDRSKEEDLGIISNCMKEAKARIENLEKDNASLREQMKSVGDDRDRLTVLLEKMTESTNVFAQQIDELVEQRQSLKCEVEALQSEIDLLQTADMNDIRTQYAARINRMQNDSAANEEKLRQEIDRVKQDLKRRDELLAQTSNVRQSTARGSDRRPLSSMASGLKSIPHSDNNSKWSDIIVDGDCQQNCNDRGPLSSRNELSESHRSYDSASSNEISNLEQVRADSNSMPMQNYHEHVPGESCVDKYSSELEAISRKLSTSSNERDAQSHENSRDTDASNEPFDWETFIDSVSEVSIVQEEHRNDSPSAIARHLNLSTSTIRHDDSVLRLSSSRLKGLHYARTDSFVDEQQQSREGSIHLSGTIDSVSRSNRSFTGYELDEYDEEEKVSDKDDMLVNNRQERCYNQILDPRITEEQQCDDHQGNVMNGEHVQNDLARDFNQMLNGLEQKRKEEEQKASQAEQALLEFQQMQQASRP